jgi:signal transduction histidine kinase
VQSLGHEDRLEHVIGHLVQNALDASRPGEPVAVRVRRDAGHAILEVEDHGVGMTDAYVRERLGKPFESTKPAGMGIGVYESSQYVASVRGRLSIDSTPGRGTCVRVLLPLPDNGVAGSALQAGEGTTAATAAPDAATGTPVGAASVETQR